jgi:hypothetical protein
MFKILQYNFLSLTRFKIAKYQFAPEYIGFILVVGLFTTMFTGISSEDALVIGDIKIMNFNIIALFYLIAPILSDIFMYQFYDPNYQYLKLLYPFKVSKAIFIDVLIELFNFKVVFLLCFIIAYIPFCLTYDLIIFEKTSITGFFLIITIYINSCLFIRVLKDIIKNKVNKSHKNYLKLFALLLFILVTYNENVNLIDLDNYQTIYLLFKISISLIILLIISLYLINVKYDKV